MEKTGGNHGSHPRRGVYLSVPLMASVCCAECGCQLLQHNARDDRAVCVVVCVVDVHLTGIFLCFFLFVCLYQRPK